MAQLLDDPLSPPSLPWNAHDVFLDSDEGSGDVPVDMDIKMTIQDELQVNQGPSGTFMETFEGCSTAFPGSKSFMDNFRQDKYAAEQRENLYFPFASREEWQFTSWLLQLCLSLSAINSLLSLDIVHMIFLSENTILTVFQLKCIPLSFRMEKQLRTHVETLPSGPAWSCEIINLEGQTTHAVHVFYHRLLECLQSLLSHLLLASHLDFVPRRVWTSATKTCHIYHDWLSSDQAWDIQKLSAGATILGVMLSSDKTNISIMTGNCMAQACSRTNFSIKYWTQSCTLSRSLLLLA
ncbi:hypothetical protein JVT61DRAFT_12109 [Boletus reticuloceps]|uniref:Uncharacterized protein n=1 Tax=Boletus reticuloceps TaxID=495285 RepID=A0A8I3A3E8_9AGAM|nr:hypothetical protein JVT61DRAFT_12109 [Boletus reticuloceps]